ncbi:hypothetical protein [Nocardia jejuensis]|uniref:hypothetical protein n=1 Tax=Nocardia jejuensis TaxID=328049 RepID=UPI000834C9BB|nr:hypothetical protein [Nocardia jejuensis]
MDRNAFVEVMNEASGMLEAGQADDALARLTAFDDGLLEAPDPKDYGWVVSYRFRAAFAAGDFEQALHIAERGPARFPADIPPGTLSTMYSMGVEAATQLDRAESAVTMADRCIELRRGHGDHGEVLMAAMTAATLLGDIDRHDLASRYAQLLVVEGEGHDEYRGYGYYALCAAIENGVGDHLIDTLRAGREWLVAHDNEFARVALEYLDDSPAVGNPAASPVLAVSAGAATELLRIGDPIPVPAPAPAPDLPGPQQPPAEQIAGGETADALLDAQRPGIAAAAYRALAEDAVATGKPDPLIMGKSVLGLLMALIFDNRVGEAHSVWIDEQGPTYLGIWSLENGQTSVHDAIAYNLVAAFLHSLSTGDRNASNHAVDSLMGRSLDWAYEHDPQAVPPMLNTWRRHLHEIHEGDPTPEYLWNFEQAAQRWNGPIPDGGLYWMRPYRWVVDWL